jgi:phosphate transport system substrate-binding protein
MKFASAGILFVLAAATAHAQSVTVDPKLPDYRPVKGVSGSIKSVGSDTMNNMMTLWAEGFLRMYPNVQVEIEGKGSSTAPPALISGASNFGPMSRRMKSKEVDEFESAFGYKPVQLPASIDMLAVYVNKDNPVDGLSLAQLDAIFSKTRKFGADADIRTWGDAGQSGSWRNSTISLYGRNAASGTYGYFKKHALGKGDYKDSVKEQPGSSSVVQGVASDKNGIGYSGIGYKTADVKAISLSEDHGGEMIEPTPENGYAGDYPLSRYLWLAVNYRPGSEIDPLRREFVKYIYSRQGQEAVVKDGYLPVTAEIAKDALAQIGVGIALTGM